MVAGVPLAPATTRRDQALCHSQNLARYVIAVEQTLATVAQVNAENGEWEAQRRAHLNGRAISHEERQAEVLAIVGRGAEQQGDRPSPWDIIPRRKILPGGAARQAGADPPWQRACAAEPSNSDGAPARLCVMPVFGRDTHGVSAPRARGRRRGETSGVYPTSIRISVGASSTASSPAIRSSAAVMALS